MTDLILHIGLPKTATTTIQDEVLKNKRGYLGKNKKIPIERDFGKQLKHLSHAGRRAKAKEGGLHAWYSRVQKYIDTHWPEIQRVIVSHEGLSQMASEDLINKWPIGYTCDDSQVYDKQIIQFLNQLSKKVWTTGNVKVLLTLRNQPEWLASLYVQLSKLLKGASQEDFERQIDKLIESGDGYMDWSRWVGELHYHFGEKNVCVLLLEDMDKQFFWDKLSEFLEIDIEESEKQQIKDKYLNKRRGNVENCWLIPSLRPIKYVKKKENLKKNKLLYRTNLGFTRVVSTFVDITRFDRKRDKQIELHEELQRRILEYCRPFNERLADQLGLDLKERGYLL